MISVTGGPARSLFGLSDHPPLPSRSSDGVDSTSARHDAPSCSRNCSKFFVFLQLCFIDHTERLSSFFEHSSSLVIANSPSRMTAHACVDEENLKRYRFAIDREFMKIYSSRSFDHEGTGSPRPAAVIIDVDSPGCARGRRARGRSRYRSISSLSLSRSVADPSGVAHKLYVCVGAR